MIGGIEFEEWGAALEGATSNAEVAEAMVGLIERRREAALGRELTDEELEEMAAQSDEMAAAIRCAIRVRRIKRRAARMPLQ